MPDIVSLAVATPAETAPARPILVLLPLLAAGALLLWASGIPPFESPPPPPDLDAFPLEHWIGMRGAALSLQILAPALRAGAILVWIAWPALAIFLGPARFERHLRALAGWRPPATVRSATLQGGFLVALLLLARFWTLSHYVGFPLQIRNTDAWCFYGSGAGLKAGEDPYRVSETVGHYAYPPWPLWILAGTMPNDPAMLDIWRGLADSIETGQGTVLFFRWRSHFVLVSWLALGAWGLGTLALVRPERRAFLLPLWLLLLLGHQEIATDLRAGQITQILAALLVAYALLARSGMAFAGGFLAGLTVPAKIFPGILLPYSLWTREYRAACGIATGAAVGFLLPVLTHGWSLTARALDVMRDVNANLVREPPYEHNQSLLMGISRITQAMDEPGWRAEGPVARFLATVSPVAIFLGLWLLARGIPRRAPQDGEGRLLDLAGILPVCLLAFPQISSYQFTLHTLCIAGLAIALRALGASWRPWLVLLLAWFLAQFQGYGDYEIHLTDTKRALQGWETHLRAAVAWIPPLRDSMLCNWGVLSSILTLALWWMLRRREAENNP